MLRVLSQHAAEARGPNGSVGKRRGDRDRGEQYRGEWSRGGCRRALAPLADRRTRRHGRGRRRRRRRVPPLPAAILRCSGPPELEVVRPGRRRGDGLHPGVRVQPAAPAARRGRPAEPPRDRRDHLRRQRDVHVAAVRRDRPGDGLFVPAVPQAGNRFGDDRLDPGRVRHLLHVLARAAAGGRGHRRPVHRHRGRIGGRGRVPGARRGGAAGRALRPGPQGAEPVPRPRGPRPEPPAPPVGGPAGPDGTAGRPAERDGGLPGPAGGLPRPDREHQPAAARLRRSLRAGPPELGR